MLLFPIVLFLMIHYSRFQMVRRLIHHLPHPPLLLTILLMFILAQVLQAPHFHKFHRRPLQWLMIYHMLHPICFPHIVSVQQKSQLLSCHHHPKLFHHRKLLFPRNPQLQRLSTNQRTYHICCINFFDFNWIF